MTRAATVADLLAAGPDTAPAIIGEGRRTMTYGALRALCRKTAENLAAQGIGRGDRVAIVLPNGPEMATAFVTLSTCATTAPLNPGYRAEEFRFYLSDLKAKALVIQQGMDSPARTVASELGLQIIDLHTDESMDAGAFALEAGGATQGDIPGNAADSAPTSDDIALILHTSGTTSRPKIVPLTQQNICTSAGNIAETLRLTTDDRCLNIMPLFHIHGLIGAVLSSLSAGASIWCSPGFNALRFFSWMEDAQPTWYSAVPTMHQAILSRAGRNQETVKNANLRMIRSSSSSLPPQVMLALEDTFGCPVIESYGMTEAAHQMASNLLPPGDRKPGTVGVAAGPEVAVLDGKNQPVPAEAIGEVCIRGANVTPGYEANDAANAEAFAGGWFHTGDQGNLDPDGFLTITGRLKEIINRGGEKISPREVDEILLDHPDVAQAVTFALPHEKLGEDIAAAVVPAEGAIIDAGTIRAFAAERLADFKVPRKIIVLDEIPKGATGKVQRIGLHEKLADHL